MRAFGSVDGLSCCERQPADQREEFECGYVRVLVPFLRSKGVGTGQQNLANFTPLWALSAHGV